MKKQYGLIQSGNRYYYAMGEQSYIIQIQPFPAAWRKTPSTSWKLVHGNFLHLDNLGLSQGPAGLELDPLADFDRSDVKVYRLHPSTGQFEYEPDWADAIPFTEWTKDTNWREILSNLLSEIDPGVLTKLRQFSHFHWRLLEALHEWPGFIDLLDTNPALAVCLAGRVRVGAQEGDRRSRLDYKSLYRRTEKEIAAALGFGDSDAVVSCLGKLPPDACKPHDLVSLAELIENPVTRKTLIQAETISHPALLFLRNPYLSRHLTGDFLTEISRLFPTQLDILTCPWGPLLRGGGKEDQFTWRYQQALDVVQADPDAVIESVDDLARKYYAIFMPPVLSYGGMTPEG